MLTHWTISIDWERDGQYDAPTDNIVTSDVLSAEWFLGSRILYESVANEVALSLTLDNTDRRFSPENTASPLYSKVKPFKPVRIQSDDGTTVRTHWVGWIESIQPMVNKYGQRTVEIIATGPMQLYKAAEVDLELQEDQRTDQIISKLIQQVVMPPALSSAWVLGRTGNSEVGHTTILADITAASDLEAGILTLGMAADNWVKRGGATDMAQNSFDVYRAIGDVTAAERGRFFFDREGRAVFWNRHHLLHEQPVKATFADTMADMAYTYTGLEQLKNEVIVVCHPRKISPTADEVLWELGEAIIRVDRGQKRTVYIKFQDESGNRIGGRDLTLHDLTFEQGSATATIADKATGTELLLDNSAGTTDAIVTKLVIKGRKITDFDMMEAKASSNESIVDYGRRTMRINLPSIDNLDAADSIAEFELERRKDPRGQVQSLTVKSHGTKCGIHHQKQLDLTIGDRIQIEETQTAHASSYYVIGEAHKLTQGATLYETTWYLEPTPNRYPWKLGDTTYSKLGSTTYPTY
jgi:hypothetical protein